MKSFTATTAALLSFFATVNAGTVIWDGTFDNYPSSSTFDNWSWANQVGAYQWYIHGSGATSAYLNTDPSYKNPAVTRESRGLKLTVDSTSHWNGQTMMRTELIPQTTANLGTGQLYYHFSIMHKSTNPPGTSEHQVFFFESHFTELKVGIGSDTSALNWCIGGQSKWSTPFTAGVWYNFAYDINFSGSTVGLWASTGSAPLTRVQANQAASTSTNSADFHVGVLRLGDSSTEDWYISGVYIESGSLTTSIGSGTTPISTSSSTPVSSSTSSKPSSSSTKPSSSSTPSSSTKPASSSTSSSTKPSSSSSSTKPTSSSVPTSSSTSGGAAHWAQCGGIGWTGATTCVSPYTCTKLNDWYYQCL